MVSRSRLVSGLADRFLGQWELIRLATETRRPASSDEEDNECSSSHMLTVVYVRITSNGRKATGEVEVRRGM